MVNPSTRDERFPEVCEDVVIRVGFDVNNDGELSFEEVERIFGNTVIGYNEYLNCRNILLTTQLFTEMFLPVAHELLDIFMGNKGASSASITRPYLLEYGGGSASGGYSQSNGMGINSPELTSGTITSYYWNTDSLMSQKICESDEFITAVIESVYDQALRDATEYYEAHPEMGSHDFTFSDVTVNLSYSGITDLAMALGHCQASLNVSVSTAFDGSQIFFSGISITGLCTDLYDFATLLGFNYNLDLDEKLVYAASAVQMAHRSGVREEGEIFRVEAHLGDVYLPRDLVLLEDREGVISSL